ncbi:hypothetical protein DFH28DRAFT_888992, partial [Melampsora americana]
GTRMQQRSKKHLRDKQRALKDKFNVYMRNVEKFNTEHPSPQPIECPLLVEVLRMSLADRFWDIGQLTHPEEAWAVDRNTQDGIQAYLIASHSHDELRRVGRECRQAAKWALDRQQRISAFSSCLELEEHDTETVQNRWLVSLVGSSAALSPKDRLDVSKRVLKAVYARMNQDFARLCMFWNIKMNEVIDKTRMYSQLSDDKDELIKLQWAALARDSRLTWKSATEFDIVESTPLDEAEVIEQNFRLLEIDVDGNDVDGNDVDWLNEVNLDVIEGDGDSEEEEEVD